MNEKVQEIFNTFSENQKQCLYKLIDHVIETGKRPNNAQLLAFNDKQKILVISIANKAFKDRKTN